MVLGYYGINEKEAVLAKKTKANPQTGATTEAMLKVAKDYDLTGFIKNEATFTDISHYVLDRKIPVIVDWFQVADGHYSVVVDINQKHLYLIDPYEGQLISHKLNTFKRIWFDFPEKFLEKKEDLILRQMLVLYRKPQN